MARAICLSALVLLAFLAAVNAQACIECKVGGLTEGGFRIQEAAASVVPPRIVLLAHLHTICAV